MTYEEKEKLEQTFKYALDNIVSNIKGKTATEIIVCEQSMILLFQELMLKIERQSIRIQELKEKNKSIVYNYEIVVDKLENSTPNDKIKAKIEELEKQDREDRLSHNYLVIPVLQSLLEKE